MKKDFSRLERIEAQMQTELALLMQNELADPRIKLVTITGIKVSADLAHAKVYITVRDDKKLKDILKILKNASPFLRRLLARNLQLRKTPELHFFDDETLRFAERITQLLK